MIGPTTISAENLMVPKSKIMAATWGEDKQRKWGYLTYVAILGGFYKLQNNEFKTFDDLLNYMAENRRIIGVALDHNPKYGHMKGENELLYTEMNNDPSNAFRDQLPDILAEFSRISPDGEPVQMTDVLRQNNQEVTYNRSGILKQPQYGRGEDFQGIIVQHTSGDGVKKDLEQARQSFEILRNNKNLSLSEKRTHLNRILFYAADAVPLKSGSAAVAQMIYHSLEMHFTGSSTYFDMPKSDHGSSRGISFDIIAMLSPNFPAFEKYLMANILSSKTKVNQAAPFINDLKPLKKSSLEDKMKDLAKDLQKFSGKMEKNHSTVNKYRVNELKKYSEYLNFLQETLKKIPKGDAGNVLIMQGLFEEFKTSLAKDKVFYPSFMESVSKSRGYLPAISTPDAVVIDSKANKENVLNNLQQSFDFMHGFASSMQIGNSDKGFNHLIVKCELLRKMADDFARYQNKDEPMANIVGPIQMLARGNADKVATVTEQYVQTVKALKELKNGILYPEQLDSALEKLVDEIAKDDPFGPMAGQRRKDAKDELLKMYQNIDKIQESMTKSYPLWKAFYPKMPALEQVFPTQKTSLTSTRLQTPLFNIAKASESAVKKEKEHLEPDASKKEVDANRKQTSIRKGS